MKKILFVVFALLSASVAFSADQLEFLESALMNAIQTSQRNATTQRLPHSSSSHDKGVIVAKLTVRSEILDRDRADYANLDSLIKICPIVRISENYMLGSYACV